MREQVQVLQDREQGANKDTRIALESYCRPLPRSTGPSCSRRVSVMSSTCILAIQGYLAHKKPPLPRMPRATVVLGGGPVSYERGTPVGPSVSFVSIDPSTAPLPSLAPQWNDFSSSSLHSLEVLEGP